MRMTSISCCAVALEQHLPWNCVFEPEGMLCAAQHGSRVLGRAFFAAGERNVVRVFFAGGEKIIEAPFYAGRMREKTFVGA